MPTPGEVARDQPDPSVDDLGKAGTFGTIGSIAGMLSGIPGLGTIGSTIGAHVDRDTAAAIGRRSGLAPSDISAFSPTRAAVNASSFGLAGLSMESQLGRALNSKTARNAMADINQSQSSLAPNPPGLVAQQIGPPLSRTAVAAQPHSSSSAAGGHVAGLGQTGPGTAAAAAAHGDTSRDANTAGAGGGSGSTKIVCTAMCQAYGFGSYRQAIWLQQAQDLHPAYQRGYHRIFLPLVRRAYRSVRPWRRLRIVLEFGARARTADIHRARHKRVYWPGRLLRLCLEPLCFLVGLHR